MVLECLEANVDAGLVFKRRGRSEEKRAASIGETIRDTDSA